MTESDKASSLEVNNHTKVEDSSEEALVEVSLSDPELELVARNLRLREQELSLTEQQIRLREQQLRLQEKELDNAHTFSIETLKANSSDRESERKYFQQVPNTSLRYVLFIFIILVALICYALYLNKDQFVMELVKALIFLLTGGIGGYSIQKLLPKREKDSSSKKDNSES
jgi:pilus assembly protein TadC